MLIPITIITGYLGAGKTTLLQRIIDHTDRKIAILMNEFGELAIDSKIVRGKNIDMTELAGGCVCCSLTGEFEEAIKEIREKVNPDMIVIETTGVAEPDAIVDELVGNIKGIRLDAIITIADADSLERFPSIGQTGRMQIEMADVLIINKADLVEKESLENVKKRIREINPNALIFTATKCDVPLDEILDIRSEKKRSVGRKNHVEEEGMEHFIFETDRKMDAKKLEEKLTSLSDNVIRAKGFVMTKEGTMLMNFVFGRHYLEKWDKEEKTKIVFIGKNVKKDKERIIDSLGECFIS